MGAGERMVMTINSSAILEGNAAHRRSSEEQQPFMSSRIVNVNRWSWKGLKYAAEGDFLYR